MYLGLDGTGSIISKNTGLILETKPIVTLIGRVLGNKVEPLDAGDPARKEILQR